MRRAILLAATVAAAAATGAAADTPEVRVTGLPMDVNGHTHVPAGLFGVHALKLSPDLIDDWGIECCRRIHFVPGGGPTVPAEKPDLAGLDMIIDCQGDRYYPAVCLMKPDYEQHFAEMGRRFAQRCKDAAWTGWAEFWNEPYLNWAAKPGVNYDPKFYDLSEAEVGRPMRIKGWEKPLEFLVWDKAVRTVHAQGGHTDQNAYLAYAYVGRDKQAGETFEFRGKPYRNAEMWWGRDPTQKSYYSGKQNAQFYLWMLRPFAKAVKQTNPAVQVIAGWDFHINSGGWDAWRTLYQPVIDASVQWIDGISEHHYGSNSRMTAATYEVVVAYAMAEHGKWLHCYNTETAGCVDPEVPGGRHGSATPYGAYNYGLRDIVELLYRCPDKAASRTAHGSETPGWGGGGDPFLFRLLKDLRGRLVRTQSTDLDVWPVASLGPGRLVVVLYNDHGRPLSAPLAVDAPPGATFADGRMVWVEPTAPKGPLEMKERPLQARGRSFRAALPLPPKSGVKLVFTLEGTPDLATRWTRRQAFADRILQRVEPGRPVTLNVRVHQKALAGAEAASIRAVFEGLGRGEGRLRINGRTVALPEHEWITDVPIDPRLLKADNSLVFEAVGDGYQVDMAALLLEGPAE